jgi:hypothetical protein
MRIYVGASGGPFESLVLFRGAGKSEEKRQGRAPPNALLEDQRSLPTTHILDGCVKEMVAGSSFRKPAASQQGNSFAKNANIPRLVTF